MQISEKDNFSEGTLVSVEFYGRFLGKRSS